MSTTVVVDKEIIVEMSGQGPDGPRGPQGERGEKGDTGATGNGIASIELLSTVGLVKTYRITFTDEDHFDYTVEDGNGITGVTKTGSTDNVDHYRITFDDGTYFDYNVTNVDTSEFYDKDEVDDLLADKADKSTTYTKTDVDSLLADKADADDVYTKAEADALLAEKADTDDLGDLAGLDSISYTSNYLTDKPTLGALAAKDTVDYDTEVTNKPTLGALASKDTVDYSTEVTNKPTLGTMSAEDASDYYTKDATDSLLLDKATVILSTASGSIASFSDGSASPVTALSIGIDPVQDLHGYDNPWPAGGGKNIGELSETNLGSNQKSTRTYSNGGVVVSTAETYGRAGYLFEVTVGTTYTVSFTAKASADTNKRQVLFGKADGVWGSSSVDYLGYKAITETATAYSFTFTAETTTFFVGFYVTDNGSSSGTITVTDFQLELGSSATSFAPYSNICPISGHTECNVPRTGRNVFDWSAFYSVSIKQRCTATQAEDGKVTVTATDVGSVWVGIDNTVGTTIPSSTYTIPAKVGDKFIASGWNVPTTYYHEIDKDGKVIARTQTFSGFTVTNPNCVKLAFRFVFGSSTAVGDTFTAYPQIETGDTVNSYEPPHIQTVTIDLGSTIYGALLNVLTGEMTVTHSYISDLSQMTWNKMNSTGGWVFYTTFTGYPNPELPSSTSGPSLICSAYKTLSASDVWRYASGPGIGIDGGSSQLRLCDLNIADTTTLTTALSGVQLVYPLATPLTVQLTPATLSLLQGQNNVWSDTGDVSVEYRADTKLYIDSKLASAIAELQALILEH